MCVIYVAGTTNCFCGNKQRQHLSCDGGVSSLILPGVAYEIFALCLCNNINSLQNINLSACPLCNLRDPPCTLVD